MRRAIAGRSHSSDHDNPPASADMDTPKPHPRPSHRLRGVFLLFSLASAASLIFYLLIASRLTPSSSHYALIIDGGSTGSRIHVFGYTAGRRRGLVDIKSAAAMRSVPGLSTYTAHPEDARESLEGLLEFARQSVPRERWSETGIWLLATAGMRLLGSRDQERIMEACRKVLRRSGFQFMDEWATVISGSKEGIYAWIAANYALGSLGGDPSETSGIIELGGASAQVTFVSDEPLPQEFTHVLRFEEVTYKLYSQSFLHLGQNIAYEALAQLLSSGYSDSDVAAKSVPEGLFQDPCSPRGYINNVKSPAVLSAGLLNSKSDYQTLLHAGGNFTQCRSAALMLLQKEKDKCSYKDCLMGSSSIPKLRGKFLATENFFHTSKFFGLGPTSFLSDMVLAGKNFCGEDWVKLKKKYHDFDDDDLVRYCFSSAYIVALLHDHLGIDMDAARIQFANQVGNLPLDWPLGAFIAQTASASSREESNWFPVSLNSASLSLILPIALIVAVFTTWSMSRWRKTRVKIIYDMEKGRYIIKHINR